MMGIRNGLIAVLVGWMVCCSSLGLGSGHYALAEESASQSLYIAKDGSDANDGSIGHPFATLEKARDTVRALKSAGGLPPGGITVYIREGEYRITDTFTLEEQDSGTPESPVVYKAYPGEKAIFTGGDRLDASLFKPVTDPAVRSRLPQETAGKVLQADLKSLGITDYGVLGNNLAVAPELFVSGNVMTIARWPNNGFTTVNQVVYAADSAAGTGYTFTYKDGGLHRWAGSAYTWMLGYWGNDWATNDLEIKSINPETKTIETYKGTSYAMKAGQRFYFYNILEELDMPGEWYLDRDNSMLYFYPPAPLQDKKVQLSLFTKNLITLNNASNIVFSGLTMEVNRGNAIDIAGGANNRIEFCEISKMGGYAVKINGGTGNGVYGSRIYSMGNGGVYLNGGDFTTLTPAGNYADYNDIYNYARIKLTYTSAVELNGVGNRASHNKMHDAPHLAIQFRGNDHVMEYNEIYDVVKETADASAIYSGRSFVWRGNTIRYNYFHDIIASDLRVSTAAIYLDDYMSGVEMRGNVFYRIGKQAFKLANGRENIVENNIVIDSGTSIAFMTRDYKPGEKNYISLMSKFDQVPYQSEIWSSRYPTLPDILNDEPLLPKRNVVRNNAIVSSGAITGDSRNMQLGTFENNVTFADKEALSFADAAHGDFALKGDSPIFVQIPGFQRIPFEEIGTGGSGLPGGHAALSKAYITYPQNGGDTAVDVSWNGNRLDSVRDENETLVQGADYSVTGNSVILTKAYLSRLSLGYHAMTFAFNSGGDAFLVVNVAPPASSELSVSSVKYPQNSGDLTVGVNLNGNALVSIQDNKGVLAEDTDYTSTGTSIIFKKAYLAKLPIGTYTLKFSFSAGEDAALTVQVVNGSLTLNKSYFASSQWSSDYGAAKAFDANVSTRWSAEKGKTAGQYLGIDFGEETEYNEVVLKETSYPRVNNYVLQYSEDGINYIDIPGTAGTSIGAAKTIRFAPVTSQYLRLWMTSTKLESGVSKEPTINEFEVYREADPAPITLKIPADLTVEATGERTPTDIGQAVSDEGVTITNDAPLDFPLGKTAVTWKATDASGRTASAVQTVTVVDTTPPIISGAPVSSPNASGWYNSDVTVRFSATDSGSGIASVTPDTVLGTEGADQEVTGTAADRAGNTASFTVKGIHIDKTGPGVSIQAGAFYKTSDTLTVAYAVYDSLSGVHRVSAALDGTPISQGQPIPLAGMAGRHVLEVRAEDQAGNVTVQSAAFEVVIEAKTEIHPDTLNLKSQGGAASMTVLVELPPGSDASAIDGSTVLMVINGTLVAAEKGISSLEEAGGGQPQVANAVMVKFDRQKVIEAIDTKTGDIPVQISGALKNGNRFSGTETIRIIP